jgi:hypothetical protein
MGCGIAALLAVGCVVLSIGGCVGLLVKGAKDFPAWAQAGVANPANKDVTDRINEIIANSTSLAQAQAKIGAETWPPKVLYIGFKEKGSGATESDKEAFRRGSWSSNSTFIMNGNGYGSGHDDTGRKEMAIIEHQQDTSNGTTLNYMVQIEHQP